MRYGAEHGVKPVLGQYHEERAAESHKEMGAESGLLGAVFAFETNQTAEHGGNENADSKLYCHRIVYFIRLLSLPWWRPAAVLPACRTWAGLRPEDTRLPYAKILFYMKKSNNLSRKEKNIHFL